jgi:hypothetical protein
LIDRAKPFGGRLNIQPFWRNFRNEILIGPDAWSYDASRWNSLDTLTAMFMVTAVGYRNSISGTKAVEKLALDLPEHWSFHDMVYLPSHYPNQIHIKAYPKSVDPATRYGVILDAFRPLKHLTLRCPSVDDDVDLDGIAQVEEANEILTTAVGLQSLYLDFGEPGRSYEDPSGFYDRVDPGLKALLARKDITYPHLQELRISAFLYPHSFNSFLLIHKETLKSLDIRDSFCHQWDPILETVGKTLKLDRICLESLYSPAPYEDEDDDVEEPDLLFGEGLDADDKYAQDMKAFLYTGEGSMPLEEDYQEVYDANGQRVDRSWSGVYDTS